jgi:hypothetical protein
MERKLVKQASSAGCHPDSREPKSIGKRGESTKLMDCPNNKTQSAKLTELDDGQRRIHRRDMPVLPKRHKDLETHPLGDLFREAEKTHLESHKEMHSGREVQREEAAGKELLDCMWVYVYKFDKHGWFTKCKARLVVRGDQQTKSANEDTYASTLAGRSFRTLMAIAARFDLELIQYDVVNAFVNAELKQDVYMRMPGGYRKPGLILKLQKALYGLCQSQLLWQKGLTTTLTNLGFKPVPHEPCCLLKEGIMIFFYVDDLIVAYKKRNQDMVDWMIGKLREKYQLSGGDILQWFLGIEVLRDRNQHLIWLSQSSFIDKIINHFRIQGGKNPLRQ